MRGRMPGWVGRPDRNGVEIPGALRVTGLELPVTITDMSPDGCKVRTPDILPIGEAVEIEIPTFLPTPATVRWSLPGIAGLRFDR